MSSIDAANPWSWDAFSDEVPKVDAPAPFKAKPRMFPEEDRLFKVQKDALKAAQLARELERTQGRHEAAVVESHTCSSCGQRERHVTAARPNRGKPLTGQLVDATEDTYRTIRSYLDKYVTGTATL